ncbi:cupredoxin domain-containing protein [Pseudooceanicola spongiae]|nr:plastocyanin/azurin family copper-binding protein [Pseudooceanicola spongiae]
MKIMFLTTTVVSLALGSAAYASGDHAGTHAEPQGSSAPSAHGHGEMMMGHDDAKAEGHGDDHAMMAIGHPATGAAARTVTVTMKETDDGMAFAPASLDFATGETVMIHLTNAGALEHEFVMDTPEDILVHKTMMEDSPEMAHSDANALRLEPGAKGQILWTFANAGRFEFACLIPGHYDAGMHGALNIH